MHRRANLSFAAFLLILMLALSGCGSTGETVGEGASFFNDPPGIADQANPDAADQDSPETGTHTLSETADRSNSDIAEEGILDSTDRTNAQSYGQLQVHFIDVGQGQAQLIIGPTGKPMLIDGGNNDMEETIVAYLRDQGIREVDILIGTHPDADHTGGLDAVVDHFEIGKIYMPRIQSNTRTFESLLLSIRKKGLKITTAKAGLTLDWEPDVEANMIAPVGTYESTNDMSAVVHLKYGDTAFLFTGDAGEQSEADILRSGANVKADVLLVGHHGSSGSTSEAFLEKVAPAYGVIQAGSDNSYGHPHKEVLSRLSEKGIKIYRTDEQGHLVFVSDGKTITVEQNPWTLAPAETGPAGTGDPFASGQKGTEAGSESHSGQTAPDADGHSVAERTPADSGGHPAPLPQPAAGSEQGGLSDPSRELSVTARIDDETPPQNSKLTVTVQVSDAKGKPVGGAEVMLLLHYKTTDTEYRGTTNADGVAELSFRIGRAAKGFTVNGEIAVKAGDASGEASVSFTPK